VQISPWMSLHSWPRGLQISFAVTSRFIYMSFLSPYPVSVDEKLVSHRHKDTDWICLNVLT
jgi:hypothetical protein